MRISDLIRNSLGVLLLLASWRLAEAGRWMLKDDRRLMRDAWASIKRRDA